MIEGEGGFSIRLKDPDPSIAEIEDTRKRVAGLKDYNP
jgi:hypothetical protein